MLNSEAYYKNLLTTAVLKRPENLAEARVDPLQQDCCEETNPKDFIEQFQKMLDHACAEEDFLKNASYEQGLQVPFADFIKGKAEVWLFSASEVQPRSEHWIVVSPYGKAYGRER